MPKLKIFLFAFFIFVLIAGIYFILINSLVKQSDANFLDKTKNTNTKADSQNNEKENEANAGVSGRIIAGGGGGSSSSSSGGGAQSTGATTGSTTSLGSNCVEQQISHALGNFREEETCISFSGEECTSKEITCSLIVQNLDYEISGNFVIKFIIKESGTSSEIDSFSSEVFLESREQKILENVFNVQGANADKDIECIFLAIEIPKKVVCS